MKKYIYSYPIPNLVFNTLTGSYHNCLFDLIRILKDNKTIFTVIEGVEFMILRVEISNREDDGVLLYIRRMDLYLLMLGMVGHGTYQILKITEGPTVLPFGESYADLGGLGNLCVGIEMFKSAIKVLVSYMREREEKFYPNELNSFDCWKTPIKTIAVFLCEAARNKVVCADVSVIETCQISPWIPLLITNWEAISKSAFKYTPQDGDFLLDEEVWLMYGKPLENETLLGVLQRLKANHKVCFYMISLTWNFLARRIFEQDILKMLRDCGNMSLDRIARSLEALNRGCEVIKGQLKSILRELATEEKVEITNEGMYRRPRKHKGKRHATYAPTAVEMVEEHTKKGHLSIVLFGPTDSGKTTIARKILYLTGQIIDNKMEETTDKITYFETETKRFTMLVAPGCKSCVPEMIRCVSQADLGVLVISASKKEFETEQTLELVYLARTMGVRKLVVLINKMDTVSWSNERYDIIKSKLSSLIKSSGYNLKEDIEFLPICGLHGINLTSRVDNELCDWSHGRSMFDVLHDSEVLLRYCDSPFRMPISHKLPTQVIVTGNVEPGCFLIGKVVSGTVGKGNTLFIMPEKVRAEVIAMLINQNEVRSVGARENLRVVVPRIKETEIRIGFVLSSIVRPIARVKEFIAELFVLKLHDKTILNVGYEGTLHIHSAVVRCKLIQIQAYNRKTKEKIVGQLSAENGEFAWCRIQVANLICIERYVDIKELGCFALRSNQEKTVAVGTVTELVLEVE